MSDERNESEELYIAQASPTGTLVPFLLLLHLRADQAERFFSTLQSFNFDLFILSATHNHGFV